MGKNKVHVLLLDEERKKDLLLTVNAVIDIFEKNCKSADEQAFCLRVLLESFEETQHCVVPFKNRYTEPVYNYHKRGADE